MKELYYSEFHSRGGEKMNDLIAFFEQVKTIEPQLVPCPDYDPFPEDSRIKAIRFSTLPFDGRSTSAFAYVGFPDCAAPEKPVPGMVLVHGGAGHAYAEWVQDWVKRGFAAISFDGFCQTYTGAPHTYDASLDSWAPDPEAYPPMTCFIAGDVPFEKQGFTYYVADILLAHNLLRADKRVNKELIGLTGISWGGYAGTLAACLDDRFAFAAPVYGSGFQNVSKTNWGRVFRDDGVADRWDAGQLLGKTTMPFRFYNGDGDPFFDADSTTASAAAAPNGSLTLLPGFTHGQIEGSTIPELFRFAEEQIGHGDRNIRIDQLAAEGDGAVVSFSLPEDVEQAQVYLYYKTEDLIYEDKELKEPWRFETHEAPGGKAFVPIPDEAALFYFCVEGKTNEGQTLHAATGVYRRETWDDAETTD